jgi:pimeloyl-ACP methyl ester carboxylesterase
VNPDVDREEATMNTLQPTFRWLERGHGEPVVLLHGLLGTMDHWDGTLDALAPLSRALAPEVPILDGARAEASVEGLARHVAAFMEALELPPAVVGGNSLGGHLALELALRYPDRVSGLILTGSSGLFERGFTRGVPHVPTAAFVREKMEEVFYDASLVTPSWVESVRRVLTTRASALRVLHVARSAKRSNLESRLGEIRVPTLLAWGKDDCITPPEVAERFRALLPHAQLEFIANCGHAPMLEQPLIFNALVEDWLDDTRARRHATFAGAAR